MIYPDICTQCGHGGGLRDGLCRWCADEPAPAPRPTIAEACAALAEELAREGVGDPLAERLPLALVIYDVCRIAGVEPPAAVLAFVDAPAVRRLPARDLARWSAALAD